MAIFERIQRLEPVREEEYYQFLLDSPSSRMQQIIPNLWLGNQISAGGMVPLSERTTEYLEEALSTLKAKNITHIISFAEGLCVFPGQFQYLQFRVADHSSPEEIDKMSDCFSIAFEFIEGALMNGTGVLVHCNAGMSRSPSLVISYLMKKNSWSYENTLKYVRRIRKCINSTNFEPALLQYEAQFNIS